MSIKKINEFPVASGVNLTPDDIFLMMDDPSGVAATKKVSLSTLSAFLGNGGGGTSFEITQVDLHNGGNQNAQVLKFDNPSYQSVITGPTPAASGNTAQRLIIQGQRAQGGGEGGDVYVWGGDADANGGDIKIYAGDADSNESGYGGYINIDAGNGYNQGGQVSISAGNSSLQGGDVNIRAGYPSGNVVINADGGGKSWNFKSDGTVSLPSDALDGGSNSVDIKSSNYAELWYRSGPSGTPNNYLQNPDKNTESYIWVESDGFFIQNYRSNDGTNPYWGHQWHFDNNGKLQFPDNLVIGNSIISNLEINNIEGSSLSNGSQIEVALAKTVISNAVSNSLNGSSVLLAGSLVEIGDGKVVMANQTVNSLDGGSSSLTGRKQIEVNSSGVLIGTKVTNTLNGDSLSSFNGWTFDTTDNHLTLPLGGILSETNNTVSLMPPTAQSGQSLVVRPTAAIWAISSSNYIEYGNPITIVVTLQNWAYFGTVNYTISGTGVTPQSLGRALTGKLTFVSTSAPDAESITWTIPANSNISEFTLTLTSVDGTRSTNIQTQNNPALYYSFEESNGMPIGQFITVTNNGISSSEHSHVHLVAGNPSTVDIYLGDDDQYVKIEKDGGDVVVGTKSEAVVNRLTLITNGTGYAVTPNDVAVLGGSGTGMRVNYANNGGSVIVVVLNTLGTGYQDGDILTLSGGNGNCTFRYNNHNAIYNNWTFGTDGSTILPNGVSIDEYYGSQFPRIVADSGKAFSVQGQGSTGSAALAWMESASTSSQYAAVGVSKGGGDNLANVVITAGASTPTLKVWRFDENGKLKLPIDGDILDSNGTSVLGGGSTTVVSSSYSSTINTDAATGDIFDITLTGNTTLANPTNPVNGKTLRWRITQDGTGNRTVALGNKFNIPSSATSPLPFSTAANKMDILAATYHAGRDKWDIVAFVPGY